MAPCRDCWKRRLPPPPPPPLLPPPPPEKKKLWPKKKWPKLASKFALDQGPGGGAAPPTLRVSFKLVHQGDDTPAARRAPRRFCDALCAAWGVTAAQMTMPKVGSVANDATLPLATRRALWGTDLGVPDVVPIATWQLAVVAAPEVIDAVDAKVKAATFDDWARWLAAAAPPADDGGGGGGGGGGGDGDGSGFHSGGDWACWPHGEAAPLHHVSFEVVVGGASLSDFDDAACREHLRLWLDEAAASVGGRQGAAFQRIADRTLVDDIEVEASAGSVVLRVRMRVGSGDDGAAFAQAVASHASRLLNGTADARTTLQSKVNLAMRLCARLGERIGIDAASTAEGAAAIIDKEGLSLETRQAPRVETQQPKTAAAARRHTTPVAPPETVKIKEANPLSLGRLPELLAGIDGLVGPPPRAVLEAEARARLDAAKKGAASEAWVAAMREEHNERDDSTEPWETGNYGVLTTSAVEFLFVVDPLDAAQVERTPTAAPRWLCPSLTVVYPLPCAG